MYTCCTGEETAAGCYETAAVLACYPLPPPSPPRPPLVPPPHAPPSPPPFGALSPEACEFYFQQPTSRFHQLWGAHGWVLRRSEAAPACWGADGDGFFEDAWQGRTCASRNWYTGNEGRLGDVATLGPASSVGNPHHFTRDAPAVLGFDESIDEYCQSNGGKNPGGASGHAISCVRANANSARGRTIELDAFS